MREHEAIELLSSRWNTTFASLRPDVPFALENEQFRSDEPLWALAFVRHTTSKQLTQGAAGTRRFERRGNVIILLFGALDAGRDPVSRLVGDVRTVIEGLHLSTGTDPLWTYESASGEGGKNGKTTDGAWFQQNVTTPFRYYELK
jgi:hypothetical protein